MPRALFGSSVLLFLFGGLTLYFAHSNHQWWAERQEQIPRMERVRAHVLDKGISTTVITPRRGAGAREPRSDPRTEYRKWVQFTCRIGTRDVEGTRHSLSGSEEGWERFSKDHEYEAFWDPVAQECVLLLDEAVGRDGASRRLAALAAAQLLAGTLAAGIGFAVVRRRPRGLI